VVVVAVVVVLVRAHGAATADQLIRPSGIPSQVSTPTATLMQLSPLPGKQAPGFTLTDQSGATVSLGQFRGKVVVLGFTDSHCTDICPIVSQETVDAYHDLGADRSKVVFLSVNVNPFHAQVSDLMAYTKEHQLHTVPTWRYTTGSASELSGVWNSYGISVDAPSPTADVVHSDYLYFIDPHGQERYLASPQVDHRSSGAAYLPADQISAWGTGIALVAKSLLG